jgi:cell division protein FtsI/penicillin-binding protein 2
VQVWVPRDPNKALEIPRVPNGTTLVLTIDRDLQAKIENILDDSLKQYGAENGTVIVMDPRNGEILAMASTPRMDLNNYSNYFTLYDNGSQYNRSIGMAYEPGSVFKVLTMAAALDTGTVRPDTTFVDTGSIEVGGINIRNWNRDAWGQQDMVGCLQHSLNVCLAWVSTQMGMQNFYGYMERFGIGHPTGIDLAGEAVGRLKVPGDTDWYPVDLGTNAFGQGITVTSLQMLMAVSSIANEGHMVTPHVLYSMLRDGHQYNVPSQYAGSPINAETARTLNEMLAISLEQESSQALVPGYRLAGKTGTAQIPTEYGYDASHTNVSFIGWGPVDDPQFMVYVWLSRPSASIWSSETAAPVFSKVAEQAVIALDIPPDVVRSQLVNK